MNVHVQKKRKRSVGTHATPDPLSGALGKKRPRAAAAASSLSPLSHIQLEGEVRSRSSGSTEGAEGDTETVMVQKAARSKERKKKHKQRQQAATVALTHAAAEEKETAGSQEEIQHSPQPQKGAAKTDAAQCDTGSKELHEEKNDRETSEAVAAAKPAAPAKSTKARELSGLEESIPAGKSGKRKRGRSQAGAAEIEDARAAARQVPQEADEELVEGNGAASLQPAADDGAQPALARSAKQGSRKRRKRNRHGGGAEALFLDNNDDGIAPEVNAQPQELAPQQALPLEVGSALGVADAGRADATNNNAAQPAPPTGKRSAEGGSTAAAGMHANPP